MNLSIVIPVYNEADNIEQTLRRITRQVDPPCEVLIVYDFDEDTTLPVVQRFVPDAGHPIRLVRNRLGRGVLNAIKTGLEAARGDAVLVMMADLCDDVRDLAAMRRLADHGADVVCGSRYMPGGRQLGGPRVKGLLSRLAGLSLHWLAGIPTHDITNSLKLYSRRVLDAFTIESTGGFELGMELVVKAYLAGYCIAEVPTTWTDRTAGESRFRLRQWLPKYIRWYVHALVGRWLKGQPRRPARRGNR